MHSSIRTGKGISQFLVGNYGLFCNFVLQRACQAVEFPTFWGRIHYYSTGKNCFYLGLRSVYNLTLTFYLGLQFKVLHHAYLAIEFHISWANPSVEPSLSICNLGYFIFAHEVNVCRTGNKCKFL